MSGSLGKQLVLEGHIGLGRQTNASAEDVGHGSALLGQRVDDGRAVGNARSLVQGLADEFKRVMKE